MGILPSYWEVSSWIKGIDLCVIGAGIVGLNAAIKAKSLAPNIRVVVLERGSLPLGASSRNAGFACFGSVTELLDDLENRSMEKVMQTVAMRWEGLKQLRAMLGDEVMGYKHFGSYELFTKGDLTAYQKAMEILPDLNDALADILGEPTVFQNSPASIPTMGLTNISQLIYNRLEGQLDTGKLMRALITRAQSMGIEIWSGVEVQQIEESASGITLTTLNYQLEPNALIVATNAFTPHLLPKLDVKPSRNQVWVTSPVKGLKLRGCYHYHKGYGYIRNIGDRVLIGGWRHWDLEGEETDQFGFNELIDERLHHWLKNHILAGKEYTIEHKWSGILGVGNTKHPIVKRVGERSVAAVRLGGMGIAIGTSVGQNAAELLYH